VIHCILASCTINFVKDGEIVAAPVLALSLSFDHRQIDGATGQNAMTNS
jgi:pyruvate dehydrogenase E2 component (dihydrolipoamide acetyltransferase)